jgi:hypothetical protein
MKCIHDAATLENPMQYKTKILEFRRARGKNEPPKLEKLEESL